MPQGCASGLMNCISFIPSFGKLNPKLVGPLVESSASVLNQGDNLVSLLEDPCYPPVKCGFICNARGNCKLRTWTGCDSFKSESFCQEVLPSFHSQYGSHPWVEHETTFLPPTDGNIGILTIIHDGIQHHILVAVRVTLGI